MVMVLVVGVKVGGGGGWRGREWKGSILAGEIGYEGMLLCGGTVAVSMPLHFD